MNDTTWVKLYRKSLSNDIRRHDPTAWRLFETLLLLVDAKTGKWSGGIYQLTEADGYLNSNTIYKALIRLQKNGMITKNSKTRYSEIYICNFAQYNSHGNTSRRITGESQANPGKTLTRSKNKEVRNIYKSEEFEFEKTYKALIEFWSQLIGRQLTDSKASKDACRKLLKSHSAEDIQYAIRGAVYFRSIPYRPKVMGFASMVEKWDSLHQYMDEEKKKKEQGTHGSSFK